SAAGPVPGGFFLSLFSRYGQARSPGSYATATRRSRPAGRHQESVVDQLRFRPHLTGHTVRPVMRRLTSAHRIAVVEPHRQDARPLDGLASATAQAFSAARN